MEMIEVVSSEEDLFIINVLKDYGGMYIQKYYKLFNVMEDNNILDINNAVHMFSLQYIFAARINRDLIVWSQSHNSHGVRAERYQTPLQLWYAGNINNQERERYDGNE